MHEILRLAENTFRSARCAADALIFGLTELLRPHDLTPSQYDALRVLRDSGPQGCRASDVGVRMLTREPDVSRLLDRLVRLGYAERERAPADRRVILACITVTGRELVERLDAPVAELHARQLGHLGEGGLAKLLELLESIRRPPPVAD